MALLHLGTFASALNRVRKYLLYGPRSSTLSYIRLLNRAGARIDESLYMPTPESVFLDDTAPYLLEIGANVFLAAGVKILTHDASWLVLKSEDGVLRGRRAPVKIGRNVSVGMNSIVLCNVTICDNVIIGTNSVVDRSLSQPGVYAGNPVRLVAPYESYKALRDGMQLREAVRVAAAYYERFGTKPPQEVFNEYFWLFAPRDLDRLAPDFLRQLTEHGDAEKSLQAFLHSEPDFDGYDAFWDWCMTHKIRPTAQR